MSENAAAQLSMAGGQKDHLAHERATATFPVRKMTFLLDGGEQHTAVVEKVMRKIASVPEFEQSERPYMSREEDLKHAMKRGKAFHKTVIGLGLGPADGAICNRFIGSSHPTTLHYGMFMPTITGQADKQQFVEWVQKGYQMKIIGCYAQTELGHGSNVRGLETTATFDKENDEFVVHSPKLTSTKWWMGGLGTVATHAVTMCRLVVDGTDHGIHTFIVPIRDVDTMKPLPGINVGDIGPKLGFNTVDNGYVRFDHVRIPRRNMMSRYAKLSKDGQYSKPKHDKMGYGTMIFIRAGIVSSASDYLARAVTMAVRYSCVRRQGDSLKEDGQETAVMDYKMQQYTLFSLLATAYAFRFTGMFMGDLYQRLTKGGKVDMSLLALTHATSSGLKAVTTWATGAGITACRLASGGHGFAHYSGLPMLEVDYAPNVHYEGDNVLLSLQTARFLMKNITKLKEGQEVEVDYLRDLQVDKVEGIKVPGWGNTCSAQTPEDMMDAEVQLGLFRNRARHSVVAAADRLQSLMASGMTYKLAWNECAAELVAMSGAHCYYTMLKCFVDGVAKDTVDPALKPVLNRLRSLFALSVMEKNTGDFMASGFLLPRHVPLIKTSISLLLTQIRPDAISLVDAFNMPDFLLNSCIGRYDGAVYEGIWDFVQKNPINRKVPVDGFEEYIRPMLNQELFRTQSKL